ncbi:VOC family protein [Bacillus sp. FJAT-22090]|uniref:VOC family protein n=1 Tax=Bacillus sp. FJAT-22090 TaxID=1581038 RepID=UPI001642BF4E|nr:VOC family protein [Bacillus sp. FJAT-22090]
MNLNGNVVIWYYVEDLPSAVEWYSKVLGMKPSSNIDVAYFFEINAQTKLALSNLFKAKTENELPKSVTLDLQSDDIFETHHILKEKGVHVEEIENPILNYHEFYIQDLENNQIRFHGFRKG